MAAGVSIFIVKLDKEFSLLRSQSVFGLSELQALPSGA